MKMSAVRSMLGILLLLAAGDMALGFACRLQWDPPYGAGGTAGYKVYRRVVGQNSWSLLTRDVLSGTRYVDLTMAEGQWYEYAVTTLGASGAESPPSEPVRFFSGYRGDVNGDCRVHGDDYDLLARVLVSGEPECAELPYSRRCADANDDFRVDIRDLLILESLLH